MHAGRPIVLATTTPYDLVKPFADRLGLDDVVATRYRVRDDGTYDGTLEGPFVWSAGKLEAITAWAEDTILDLAYSYAYSDSVYDTPMLDAVGNPVVVNPDPRMVLMAAARRWPTMNLDVSPGVVKIPVAGLEVQRLSLQMARPAAYPYARFEISGVENIPADGPCHPVCQPPELLRCLGDVDRHRQERPDRPIPRQEGSLRRSRCRTDRSRNGRHQSRPGNGLEQAASSSSSTRSKAVRWWR